MDKFLVPQYIDVEPKIIGPVTVRQFIEMLVCALIDFIIYKLFYFNIFVVLGLINTAIFLIIAFFRINGMPFHYFVLNLLQTMRKPRLRVWNKIAIAALPTEEARPTAKIIPTKKPMPASKLSDLSLLIDTGGAYNVELEGNKK
jgi:hypothetical protein